MIAYKKRENHDVQVTGWPSGDVAAKAIEEGYERFRAARCSGPEHVTNPSCAMTALGGRP